MRIIKIYIIIIDYYWLSTYNAGCVVRNECHLFNQPVTFLIVWAVVLIYSSITLYIQVHSQPLYLERSFSLVGLPYFSVSSNSKHKKINGVVIYVIYAPMQSMIVSTVRKYYHCTSERLYSVSTTKPVTVGGRPHYESSLFAAFSSCIHYTI